MGNARFVRPFGLVGTVRRAGERYLVGDGASFEIREYARTGELARLLRVRGDPPRFTAAARAAERARMAANSRGSVLAKYFDAYWERAPVPEKPPAYQRFETDQRGRLWIEAYPLGATPAPRWFVLDVDWRPLGMVELPRRFDLRHIYDDAILGVQRDADGIESVVLYALDAR